MKFFITVFALLTLLGGPVAFAEDSKEAAPAPAADTGSKEKAGDKKADDNKASEEEPDCD